MVQRQQQQSGTSRAPNPVTINLKYLADKIRARNLSADDTTSSCAYPQPAARAQSFSAKCYGVGEDLNQDQLTEIAQKVKTKLEGILNQSVDMETGGGGHEKCWADADGLLMPSPKAAAGTRPTFHINVAAISGCIQVNLNFELCT